MIKKLREHNYVKFPNRFPYSGHIYGIQELTSTPYEQDTFVFEDIDLTDIQISDIKCGYNRWANQSGLVYIAPSKPFIDASATGQIDELIEFSLYVNVPGEYKRKFFIDYGDGESFSSDFVDEGVDVYHQYHSAGVYKVVVYSETIYGSISENSDIHTIIIS